MKFDINNLKHWQLIEEGDLAGYYVRLMLGIPMNGPVMAIVNKEAEVERKALEKRGYKVAVIQPKGGNSYSEAMAKLLKVTGRQDDLGLIKHMQGT